MALPLTSANLIKTLQEFLVVWVNQILFYNRIYNSQIYDKFKSFNLVVMKNRNPQLNEFIDGLINNFLNKVLVNRQDEEKSGGFTGLNLILMVIYNIKSNQIKRKYIVNFNDLIINLGDTLQGGMANFHKNVESAVIDLPGVSWDEVYVQFSGILFQHIKELKRMQTLDARRLEVKMCEDIERDEDNDRFFKIFVSLEKSVNLVDGSWVRLDLQEESNPTTISNFISIGEVDLQVINFDLHNEYLS